MPLPFCARLYINTSEPYAARFNVCLFARVRRGMYKCFVQFSFGLLSTCYLSLDLNDKLNDKET